MGINLIAHAHSVWIEPKDSKLVVRFAEPGEKYETSPGFLDNLSAPNAFIAGTKAPTAVASPKQADCFALENTSLTNVVCMESTFTVRGGRKPIFYARWQAVGVEAGTPLLNLDLVPTGKPGEVRAYFRGQPLGGIAATLRTPDEKEQDLTTDADGYLHFKTDLSGQYLLTIPHYREPLAGFYGGTSYKETSHNAALTWQKP
jgi:hypothetical protein